VIGGDQAAAQAAVPHPQLTGALIKAGAISKDEIVRADEVRIEPLPGIGTFYDFLVPEGKTYAHVERRLGEVAGMFGKTRLHTKMERSRDNERRVRLLVLDEPPFTRPFTPPARHQIEAFAGVPFGHDVTGQLTGARTFNKASLLVAGMTQTGKTTLINGLITCLLIAYGEFDLYLLDGKFCGLTQFEKVAVRYEASDDPDVYEDMVDTLNLRADRRYERLQEAKRNRQAEPQFRPVFFIVDEAADFFAHDGTNTGKDNAARIAEKSRSLVSKCLESGISVVMLTQRPAQNAIPVMVRDQFLYRLCLYVASEGTAKVALGDTYFETIAPINPALLDPDIKGQGVLFAHGVSTLIRGFNFADEFMWEIVDEVHGRQADAGRGRRFHANDRPRPGSRDHRKRSDRVRKATKQSSRRFHGPWLEGGSGLSPGPSHGRRFVRYVTVTRHRRTDRQVTARSPSPGLPGDGQNLRGDGGLTVLWRCRVTVLISENDQNTPKGGRKPLACFYSRHRRPGRDRARCRGRAHAGRR
jgi:S-DNA-T family DNA segregation ATPase FtsK/SpoIIIE